MDEMECFSPHFIGMKVTFTGRHAGTWVLTKKLSDRHSQYSPFEARHLDGPSGAYGTFACANINNSRETTIMKVFMQIPHAGILYQTVEEKRKQATMKPGSFALSELEGYKKLTQEGCSSTPPLLNYKIEKQDANGLIPGGYLVSLLLGKLPGVQLDSVYWNLPSSERQRIRRSFRVAWENCIKAGVHITDTGLKNLFWDKENDKVYITGTRNCEPAGPEHIWKDVEFLAWRLAIPPKGYRYSEETLVHPDTSNWKM